MGGDPGNKCGVGTTICVLNRVRWTQIQNQWDKKKVLAAREQKKLSVFQTIKEIIKNLRKKFSTWSYLLEKY